MSIPRFFIDRPIFAAVISIVIILVGGLAYFTLPIAQYPEVAPPTIVVTAVYPGANASTVAETVATPIEQEINGVEDMLYMSSQATNDGRMQLTITFKLGTNLDKAQVLVQNRVAIAEPKLPEEVRRLGVTTNKSSPDILMVVHMLSPKETYDQLYISNYALLQVRDVLARLDGVGNITLFGAREYSMRVWLDPDRLAGLDLTAADVVRSLQAQNIQVAAGTLGQPPLPKGAAAFQLTVNAQGRLIKPEEFEEIIIKTGVDARFTRLRDVATVELGAQDYITNSYLNNQPAVAMVLFQRPGSNALATSKSVRATMERLAQNFPKDLEYSIVYDPTEFVAESVNEVVHTIYEAVALVVIVIVIFLQSWRASIIPLCAIPVSLIGTFAVMQVFGFSLNNLTLFGLVLAIGIVVDDAIVVVENVERNIEKGLAPREATRVAMDEVGSAIVAISLVLAAVFIPTAFLPGISGQFYRQFALTIAAATLISMVNSLTLSPALAAILLKEKNKHGGPLARAGSILFGWFFKLFNKSFDFTMSFYAGTIRRLLRVSVIVLFVYAGLIAATYFMFRQVPTGFVPQQDQGYLIVAIQLPDSASLERTDAVVKRVATLCRETPGIRNAVQFAGFSGATRANAPNAAAIFAGLQPFEKRVHDGLTANKIQMDVQRRVGAIEDASVFVLNPPPVPGIGTAGGFRMQIQDRSGRGYEMLQAVTDEVVARGMQEPGLQNVFTMYRANTPQMFADIDRTRAQMLNVPVENIFDTLRIYLGSTYVNDFNFLGRTFQVRAQADAPFRIAAEDIMNLRTRSASGAMVPLGSVMDIRPSTGPDRVTRYNLYPAAALDGNSLPGVSSGQALDSMERVAQQVLPRGFDYEWTDLAYQQRAAGNTALFIFPLSVLFVFLVLAALYESWSLPFAIILIVPMCLLSAITGVWGRGMDNNVLTQIGFIVLVALATKNAILIVEFAKAREDSGEPRFEATVEGSRLRLRPILMTSFAFILGVVPLLIATGPASEMRQAIGTAVFYGMLGVTFFGLFLTPVFYYVIRKFARKTPAQAAKTVAEKPATPETTT